MDTDASTSDYYEILQISQNADADTIHRVFRLLAQRFHPDNPETGNEEKFRQLHEVYLVLSDPEQRATYDIRHETLKQERWRFVAAGPAADNDVELEQHYRFIILEILYSRRRTEPDHPGLSNLDMSRLIGRPREHLEFTVWYLIQKEMVVRDDSSNLTITAKGVDYVEENPEAKLRRRLLTEAKEATEA